MHKNFSKQYIEPILLGGCTLLVTCFFLQDAVVSLLQRWNNHEAYSHGYLVLICSFYLIYAARNKMQISLASPSPLALIGVVGCSLIYFASEQLGIIIIQQMLVPVIILFVMSSLFGLLFGRSILVPLFLLYYAIPFWDYIAYPLQLLTVTINSLFIDLFNITAIIDGVFVTLPGIGVFEVAHGCSGIGYLMVAMMITSLYAVLNLNRLKNQLLLVGMGIFLGLLSNWLRVFIIVYVGFKSNMTSSLIEDHEMFGWVVFSVAIIPIFIFGRYLEKNEDNNDGENDITGDIESEKLLDYHRIKSIIAALFIFICLVGINKFINIPVSASNKALEVSLNEKIGPWLPLSISAEKNLISKMKGYSQSIHKSYLNDEKSFANFQLYFYPAQREGKELIQNSNQVIDTNRWIVESKVKSSLKEIPIFKVVIREKNSVNKVVVWYSYNVGGRFYLDEVHAKLASLTGYLSNRYDGSLFLLSANCTVDCDVTALPFPELFLGLQKQLKLGIEY